MGSAQHALLAHTKPGRGLRLVRTALQILIRLKRALPLLRARVTLATLDRQEAPAQCANLANSRPAITLRVCHVPRGQLLNQAAPRQPNVLCSALQVPLGQMVVRVSFVWRGRLSQALDLHHACRVLPIQIH